METDARSLSRGPEVLESRQFAGGAGARRWAPLCSGRGRPHWAWASAVTDRWGAAALLGTGKEILISVQGKPASCVPYLQLRVLAPWATSTTDGRPGLVVPRGSVGCIFEDWTAEAGEQR